ncbi:putative uncharacterized protein DDB_G0282133 [Vespa crabro]|uniref:putative uncharacterized protein DDB_G0282133 n=1 Tax=Vespa crabro TaxID=7445 RepID=UPI001F0151FE|nr:putative uncharacterized protein DDB_G0282133 [Vespa crabro]
MASREKRPLAPSKSKQKANNDSGLPSNEVKSRKGKSLTNIRQQQLARDIFEAVATGSQLPAKLEASLPRKKVLKNLKRKQKLRVTKTNFIKTKVTKKVGSKNLCRINSDIKKGIKARKVKSIEEKVEEEEEEEEEEEKSSDINLRITENHINDLENSKTAEITNKSAKINLRTKKTKSFTRISGEQDNEDNSEKDQDALVNSNTKSNTKYSKRTKPGDTVDSSPRSAKLLKNTGLKKSTIKEKENYTKIIEGDKYLKGKRGTKDTDSLNNIKTNSGVHKLSKSVLDNKSSIDLTIDEVIASMLSDSEVDNQQGIVEKVEGKITRSRKMLVDESIIPESEIKKEPDCDERIMSEGECGDIEQGNHTQTTIQLRKRSNVLLSQRSLRNGKLRQLSDTVAANDVDVKRRRRLNSDDPAASETSTEQISDGNVDIESCFSESSGNYSQITAINKEECIIKDDASKNYAESETGIEIENNNNSERVDRLSEIGPTLRSKTKARSTDSETKIDDIKVDDTRVASKNVELPEEIKKTSSLDQVRKDTILSKLTDRSKGRRNSLNIDMRKTVNSFYGTEKSDGNPKSHIDQMIENIKLTIAKSIESKIFGPEKNLGLSKNFEIPKIEEIIAPLSTESQKLGLEENTDEDKPNASKNESKSESSENSVPKVADTAKEIEKLVMGDIELVETQSQNTQDRETPNIEAVNKIHNSHEPSHATVSKEINKCKDVKESTEGDQDSNITSKIEERIEDIESQSVDNNKKISPLLRKSGNSNDKNSQDNIEESEVEKKLATTSDELLHDSLKESVIEKTDEHANEVTNESTTNLLSTEINESVDIQSTIIEVNNEMDKTNVPQVESLGSAHCSEESETLESIYSDVERLVKGDELTGLSDTVENVEATGEDVKLNDTCNNIAEDEESSLVEMDEHSASKFTTNKVEEALTGQDIDYLSNEINKQDKVHNINENVEVPTASSESMQNQKHDRNNSHVTPVINSDLNSICTSTKSPVCISKEINDSIKDANHDKEDNKHQNFDTLVASNENTVDKKVDNSLNTVVDEKGNKLTSEKSTDEPKVTNEENKRVLRVRDKQKKVEKRPTSCNREHENTSKSSTGSDCQTTEELNGQNDNKQNFEQKASTETICNTPETDISQNSTMEFETSDVSEPHTRTRRGREVKKRKEDQQLNNTLKNKRTKRDIRKSDQQKEETLLDNEVAKINENNRSFLNDYDNLAKCSDSFRGFSEGGRDSLDKIQNNNDNLRSKSENDLVIPNEPNRTEKEGRLSSHIADNDLSKEGSNMNLLDDCKSIKMGETSSQKDLDETSTSDESSSSVNITAKILETPEDKAKKESILRLLGLESLEKAAERLNHQKARKEQYTGTLKTVIRVQKEKEKDKKRSRSPLKMVLKQGRTDGEGDSPEFYTIQKEFGTSGLGDSSSGANRKFTTNHRHSCDEDNEEAPPKDRQSLVIPEKSSSFSIHPGRLCADVCCYCFGKFGSLDTPMHLAQMKSDERRKKILNIERHLTKDSCLCDACYRHVDRKANTSPTNMQTKPQKQHRQLMVSKCSARDCRDPARHHVKRRWLLKIKAGLQNQVDIDWESSQHTSMSFCVIHYGKIERFLTCALCNRRLARNHTHQLSNAETIELNQRLSQQAIPVSLAAGTFVCKLCRYFTQLQIKYKDPENMNMNHRSFFKSYRKRILHYHDIEVLENEDDDSNSQSKDKDKRKKAKCTPAKNGSSKSPDVTANSASDKSTPESIKNEGTNSEPDNDNRSVKINTNDPIPTDVQFIGVEGTVEKLKKRKILEVNNYTSDGTTTPCDGSNEVVEILAMDKEVTLTKLPKRARTNNDITPVVQRLGANPSISVRTLFPGEEEMNLHANIEFTNVREITPQGWEKCATMIQYDRDTKLLWQELQRPYGNQSSFLRHLILLEKYYRAGDLILAPNASRNAINYSTSVQNRLISYEGPEKMDEPIMEPISSEFNNSRRLSGGYVLERDRLSLPTGSCNTKSPAIQLTAKGSPPRVLKLNPGVSIIKKPPPSLQRLNLPSTSSANGNIKRKDNSKLPMSSGGKVFQLSEPDFKRLQHLKKQKQMFSEKQCVSPTGVSGNPNSPPNFKSTTTQYQKAQLAAQTQFQKHLRMQQEMLNRQSRGDFEPLICDIRLSNENSPTQNLLHNLNLPKSIQVTTKPSNPIPILPKIPKSLTVIPQTVTRPTEK